MSILPGRRILFRRFFFSGGLFFSFETIFVELPRFSHFLRKQIASLDNARDQYIDIDHVNCQGMMQNVVNG